MSRKTRGIYEVLGRRPIHPFPARMAPGLALKEISSLRPGSTVLDPMMGSGTVLAIAKANGHRAIGTDVDPLAVLMSTVWTRAIQPADVLNEAVRVLEDAKRNFAKLRVGDAYPEHADAETREFIRYWFDPYSRRQLTALVRSIDTVRDKSVRDLLWCAFSRQIITKQAGVSRALDLSHSRPHRVFEYAPRKPFNVFGEAVEDVLNGCIWTTTKEIGPRTYASLGDARRLRLADRSIDLVVTSPPYLNAIDYIRCSKFSLVWIGENIGQLRIIRGTSIGAEVAGVQCSKGVNHIMRVTQLRGALPERMQRILERYIHDMIRSLNEVARVLKKNGRAVFVVGENTIRGKFIPTGRIVTEAANIAGLSISARNTRALPDNRRYLPPPKSGGTGLEGRIRREVILSFSA